MPEERCIRRLTKRLLLGLDDDPIADIDWSALTQHPSGFVRLQSTLKELG